MAKEKGDYKLSLSGEGLNLNRFIDESVAQQIVAFVLGGASSISAAGSSGSASPGTGRF